LFACRTLSAVETLYGFFFEQLEEGNLTHLVDYFHAKLDSESEEEVPSRFASDETRCLISTIAFGMGVSIPDIRYVMHWGPPSTILDYWQEAGRCSRDGEDGSVIMYFPPYSMMKERVDKELIDIVKGGGCFRLAILRALLLPGHTDDELSACCGGERCCSVCKKDQQQV